MPDWLANTLRVVLIIALPVAIVLTNVRVLMLPWYPTYEYNKANFPADVYVPEDDRPFTRLERERYAQLALAYLFNAEGVEFLGEQTKASGAPLYNERELSHMVDVKNVTRAAMAVWIVALAVVVGASIALGRDELTRAHLRSGLSSGAAVVVFALLALVLYMLLNFTSFFTRFHQVFFESGTWIFRLDDTLIRLFPLRFWSDAFTIIGAAALLEGVLIWLAAWRFVR